MLGGVKPGMMLVLVFVVVVVGMMGPGPGPDRLISLFLDDEFIRRLLKRERATESNEDTPGRGKKKT